MARRAESAHTSVERSNLLQEFRFQHHRAAVDLAFDIVIAAHHFFLDAVGGALILCGGLGIVRWSERRRSARLAPALTGATAEQLATAQ